MVFVLLVRRRRPRNKFSIGIAVIATAALLIAPLAAPAVAADLAALKGGFTSAERQSVWTVYRALIDVHTAVQWAADALPESSAEPNADLWALAEVFAQASWTSRELTLSLAYLMHTNPEQVGTPSFANREAEPRAAWVRQAWFHLDRAADGIAATKWAIDRALAETTTPGYVDPLWSAQAIWLASAEAGVAAVDRTLPYATPLPPNASDASGKVIPITPTVVAVHGDLREAQWSLHRSMHYLHDAWDAASWAVAGVPDGWAARRVFVSGMEVLKIQAQSMLFVGGIPDESIPPPPQRPTMAPRLVETQKVIEWLTFPDNPKSTPFRYNEMLHDGLTAWFRVSPPEWTETLTEVLLRTSDSWRHSDRAAWMMLFFNFQALSP